MTRLLRCLDCRTIEPFLDAPSGVDPNHIEPGQDPVFDALVARHENHGGKLFHVEDADWADKDKREGILAQMQGDTTGFEGEFYAVRDTFKEDAMACFKAHQRPPGACHDWHIDAKKLSRPTPEGRALQREYNRAPVPYLCDFCPVASWVEQQVTIRNTNIRNTN